MVEFLIWRERTEASHRDMPNVDKSEPDIVLDEQTGIPFQLKRENRRARIWARVSVTYLIFALGFLLWLLFDTWSGRNFILNRLGYDKAVLASGSFRLMAFVAIGGALGGTLEGIRSHIFWHSEHRAYGPQFLSRDFALPLIGVSVGLIMYMAVRSGSGILSGDFSLNQPAGQTGGVSAMSGFIIASLAGFSSRQVFRWLDARANQVFSLKKDAETIVPDLAGKTIDDAKALLQRWKLTLGVTNKETAETAKIDKVLRQSPVPGSVVAEQAVVDITVGSKTEMQTRDHGPGEA